MEAIGFLKVLCKLPDNGPLRLIVGGFEGDARARTIYQPPQPHSAVDQLTVTLPVVSMEAAATRRARGIVRKNTRNKTNPAWF